MVGQKNIYDTMWASQTLKSQLSRDISLSLEHHTYNLDIDNPYTSLQSSITLLLRRVRGSHRFRRH